MIARDISAYLGIPEAQILGNSERSFMHPQPISEADGNSVTFYSGTAENFPSLLAHCRAAVIICSIECRPLVEQYIGHSGNNAPTLIFVEQPRLAFVRLLTKFFPVPRPSGVHPTAIVAPNVALGRDVYVGPYAVIDGNCSIADEAVIESHVRIHANTTIGRQVKIGAGTVIGSDGFGYVRNEQDRIERFPHIGGVRIGDYVEIGTNTSVDRGTLGLTVIGDGSKIDNQVHIAHNVVIGVCCEIIAQAMIGGSVVIGDHVWIAPSAVIRDGVKIGDRALVGLGAVVTKEVHAGQTVYGNPARPKPTHPTIISNDVDEWPRQK